MTGLLLDHPWPLDAVQEARSPGFRVLLKFDELVKRMGPFVSVVPFVEPEAFNDAIARLNRTGTSAATVFKFGRHLVRHADGGARATPVSDPQPPLSDCWKRALRDEVEDLNNWRNPQVIFPESRRVAWPQTTEIAIECEDRPGAPQEARVLAPLDVLAFEQHPHSIADLDPWRHLEWRMQGAEDVRTNHPCRLPRPPCLENIPVKLLSQLLPEARRLGWQIEGKYYFIPPENSHPELVSKANWRNGSAFERRSKDTKRGVKTGPIDFEGRIWAWDLHHEKHWDVQLLDGKHLNVSHDGTLL